MPRPPLKIDINAEPKLGNASLDDQSAKTAVGRKTIQEDFPDRIRDTLRQKWNIENSTQIEISYMPQAKGANSSSHFIVVNKKDNKTYHIKAALHGSGISMGSRFNEAAYYMLNSELKVGPKADAVIVDDVLMIMTEDLSKRKGDGKDRKEVSFEDNDSNRQELSNIPARQRESVHRCATEIVINLCYYADVQKNLGNTGFKITKADEEKKKPFIVDFRLANENDLISKYANEEGYQEIRRSQKAEEYGIMIGERLHERKTEVLRKDLFNFDEDPEVFKEALKKLFIKENGEIGKFQEAVRDSFEKARALVPQDDDRLEHLKVLKFQEGATLSYIDKFLENNQIKDFLRQAVKPSPNPNPSSAERSGPTINPNVAR